MYNTNGQQKLVCLCKLRMEEGVTEGELGGAVGVRTQILIFSIEGASNLLPRGRIWTSHFRNCSPPL